MDRYPKRLIEVDLPIRRISKHSQREKQFPVPRGHLATMHTWWARRPLAACRAVLCASLWPDPADAWCPNEFRIVARRCMDSWAKMHIELLGAESIGRFMKYQKNPRMLDNGTELRHALLSFIADFSAWKNGTRMEFLQTAKEITKAALKTDNCESALLVDPFSGGGAIPLESLRLGLDCFAGESNPVAILLQKVALEYIPRFGEKLIEAVKEQGGSVSRNTRIELQKLYTKADRDWRPVAYLWARKARCEGPACGVEVPLLRTLWLTKKRNPKYALKFDISSGHVAFRIIQPTRADQVLEGTVKGGSCTCPVCGHTMKTNRLREQLIKTNGGADSAVLYAVVERALKGKQTRCRLPIPEDMEAYEKCRKGLSLFQQFFDSIAVEIPKTELRRISVPLFGINRFTDLFNSRQLLSAFILAQQIQEVGRRSTLDRDLQLAVSTTLAIAFDKIIDFNCSLSQWRPSNEDVGHLFGRQAIGMVWDYAETNLAEDSFITWDRTLSYVLKVLENLASSALSTGRVELCSALASPLPDDSALLLFTDPPYYDSVPYSHLSDFFYVWLRLLLRKEHPEILADEVVRKDQEIVVDRKHSKIQSLKTAEDYELKMKKALAEGRRVLHPRGLGIVVFAHKSTAGWEALLSGLVDSGWVVTASWPIDTESSTRTNAMGTASLASSVHLICRPRENKEGSNSVGAWRDVIDALPKSIHDWMPRLAEEGVVGADAIFACLGPALEIFSRYSHVEKASGEIVTLKEYLEHVWAAVSKEALKMIFEGADASGFEEDARLTAMWLWTVATGGKEKDLSAEAEENEEEEEEKTKKKIKGGFSLEYDAARKIAQGLGAHLEDLNQLVEIQGETAILLPVAARTRYLFGKDSSEGPRGRPKKKDKQLTLSFEGELKQIEKESGDWTGEFKGKAGKTVLDQVHQSMILFAAGRGEALKLFLVEDGIGRNPLYWRLAQSLSALYPTNTDEKRWVDGVLARKKGLGF